MLNISVITPSYNQGEFIERTIQSVLTQSYPAMEYLVFDACSTDTTIEVLKKYEEQLTWVSEKDKGQADAVNKGLKLAKGDIIAWLNSDDIYYPEAFQTVIDFFLTHSDVDIIYGNANHIDKMDNVIEAYSTESWDYERLKTACYLSQPAVFFRKNAVEKYGVLDEDMRYCMDYEYWLRLGLKGARFAFIPQILAGSRLYQETKTMGQRIAAHAEINTMLKKLLGLTPDPWLSHYAHAVLDSRGFSRENQKSFLPAVIILTTYASLRWNKKISKSLRKMLKQWMRGYLSMILKRGKK